MRLKPGKCSVLETMPASELPSTARSISTHKTHWFHRQVPIINLENALPQFSMMQTVPIFKNDTNLVSLNNTHLLGHHVIGQKSRWAQVGSPPMVSQRQNWGFILVKTLSEGSGVNLCSKFIQSLVLCSCKTQASISLLAVSQGHFLLLEHPPPLSFSNRPLHL